ncbi:MAG: hypothetical protein HY327_06830 [Chloroflexi bacterium]|nr:hypothetical protein [Chloroflexota bacterium]
MQSSEILEWVKVISGLVCSWPTLTLLALIVFRKPLSDLIKRFSGEDVRKAKIGPVELERELGELANKGKQAVDNMSQLNELMAESRLLELEITEGMFSTVFSEEQRKQMRKHIDELRKLTAQNQQEKK